MQKQVVTALLIALVLGIVFANTLSNEFHFDDLYIVKDNPGIEKLLPLGRHFVDPGTMSSLPRLVQYRPLLPLTLSISYYFSGYSPSGYHLGNILAHGIASLLVYYLALELLLYWTGGPVERRRAHLTALAVALGFAVHPVSGFPINYVSARDLILMLLFLTGSLLAYVRMRRKRDSISGWVVTLVLLLLSLFSKTNAVVAPALIFFFEVTCARQRPTAIRPWLRSVPFAVVVLLHLAFKRAILGFTDFANAVAPGGYWTYGLTQAKVHLFEYARNFVWPMRIRLTPRVDPAAGLFEPQVLLGLALIAGSLVVAWFLRRSRPVVSFSILAYWVLLLPTSSFIKLFYTVAHYRPYPSSPFLFLAVAAALVGFRSRWVPVIVTSILLYFASTSVLLNRTWRTEESAWLHSVRHGGEAVAHLNYARSLPDRTDPRVREQMEQAVELEPGFVVGYLNLGLLYMDLGDDYAGIKLIERAVELKPNWAQSHYWLSLAYERLGRQQEALGSSTLAADNDPRNSEYQYRAAWHLQAADRYGESLEYLERVTENDSRFEDSLLRTGLALQKTGRATDAVEVYERLLSRKEPNPQAHFNLAHALMSLGQPEPAIEHFERVLELRPEYSEVHYHLATCYELLGDPQQAEFHRDAYERESSGAEG
jgi:tetratricopeptide (TPR) repeat protein